MKANQTNQTTARTVEEMRKAIKTYDTATASTDTKTDTRNRLEELTARRNELIKALEHTAIVKEDFDIAVHEVCEVVAQIAVYKTLFKLSDSAKDIGTSGAKVCEKLYRDFVGDMAIYRTKDTTRTYSDAMDLFNVAYIEVWQYLDRPISLTLSDTVETKVLKNGTEKNYTLFQTACKSIREYIHGWSKTDNYKKLHYIVGIADNGELVTTSKRPKDALADIDESTRTAFFNKYGLTAQQQEITAFLIKGENAQTISILLNIPLRTVQDNIKKAKAKFTTASAYADYITAQSAEKVARAKALKNPTDSLYQIAYTRAQERTATTYKAWQTAFHKENASEV